MDCSINNVRINIHYLILFFIHSIYSFSQPATLQRLDITHGLPSNHVYNVLFDHNEYTWICTEKGLVKYDGRSFKTFDVNAGFPTSDVWDVFEDSQGRIWPFTFGPNIHYIKNDSVFSLNHPELQSDLKVVDILELENGSIIFTGRGYIITLSIDEGIHVIKDLDLSVPKIVFLESDNFEIINNFYNVKLSPRIDSVIWNPILEEITPWNLPVRYSSSLVLASNELEIFFLSPDGLEKLYSTKDLFDQDVHIDRIFNLRLWIFLLYK